MNLGLSDQIRALAKAEYVHPARMAGKKQFSISVRDLLHKLETVGFPSRNTPQVCSALQTSRFLRENGLEIEGVDGPPSKVSTTVVFRYRVANPDVKPHTKRNEQENKQLDSNAESPEAWAFRVTEKARGLLKEELAEYGGGEAFLRWVRSEDEDNA